MCAAAESEFGPIFCGRWVGLGTKGGEGSAGWRVGLVRAEVGWVGLQRGISRPMGGMPSVEGGGWGRAGRGGRGRKEKDPRAKRRNGKKKGGLVWRIGLPPRPQKRGAQAKKAERGEGHRTRPKKKKTGGNRKTLKRGKPVRQNPPPKRFQNAPSAKAPGPLLHSPLEKRTTDIKVFLGKSKKREGTGFPQMYPWKKRGNREEPSAQRKVSDSIKRGGREKHGSRPGEQDNEKKAGSESNLAPFFRERKGRRS